MSFPRGLAEPLERLRHLVKSVDRVGLRHLSGALSLNLGEIALLASPEPRWHAARDAVRRRVAALAEAVDAGRIGTERRSALEAIDALEAALAGVPPSAEANGLGLAW